MNVIKSAGGSNWKYTRIKDKECGALVRVVRSLWGSLDRKETAKNAERVLSDFHHRKQRARAWSTALQSPQITDMPSSEPIGNPTEKKIVNHLSDDEFVARCIQIVEAIEDDTQRGVLTYTYIKPLSSVELIAERLAISRQSYYRYKESALVAFAELWPPIPSELLVYR